MEQNGGDEKENYLAHYGVVGMRWGIRRYQPYSYTGARRSGRAGKEIGEAAKLGKKAAKAVGKGAKIAGKSVASGVKKYREYRRERKRQDLINNGTSRDLKANRGKLLTEDDVKRAIERIKDDITLDDLAKDVHMKAIKRGKEALNLTKDLLNAGFGVYTAYRNVKSAGVDRAIDMAVANNDATALERLSNRKDLDRKQQKEIRDLVKEYTYDKPLKKAYDRGDTKAIERIENDSKAGWETRDKAREYRRDLSYRQDSASIDAFYDAVARGDFKTAAKLISERKVPESHLTKIDPQLKRINSLQNHNNPNSSKKGISKEDLEDAMEEYLKKQGLL